MPFIEAPTTFYLGRRYDPGTHKLTDDVVYYDSRDLTTHAVVVGMTGSGKTGLCINLLEEAVLDNIPAIVVDPKGDITNLLLTFPDLRPEDFHPWVNIDDARRAGMDVGQYAADVAYRWREGLASWSIDPIRMRWLKQATQYSIYTPGSDTGLPVNILASLRAPRNGWAGNEEENRERINGIVTALLALAGRDAQPVQDKEHVLVANIFEYAWTRGIDLTLEDIIRQVQNPPFNRLGVFPVDEYISEKNRQKLALELNSIVAAPSFQSWLSGDPMDIQNLLYQPDGRPRVSIFYIAHLSDAERLFIITLLLENMLGWMRTLSGTTSLRALLYIDEMFGYFPPYPRNPPTKEPILRLLKQARAFGIGLILATQNPGDLDYKGLSNAGTWFIGRLQSENDKQKVMTGLESMVSVNSQMDLRQIGRLISELEPRVFLMHNVHDQGGPVMLHTRWAMSYLRGPLTRQQVQVLMQDQRAQLLARIGAAGYVPPAPAANPNFTPGPSFASQAAYYSQQVAAQYVPPTPYSPPTPPPMSPQGVPFPPSLPEMPPSLPELPETPTATAQQFTPGGSPVVNTPPPVGSSVPLPSQPIHTGKTQANRVPTGFSESPPPLPASTAQYFLPNAITSQQAIANWERKTGFSATGFGGAVMAYKPVLLAQATIRYQDRKTRLYVTRMQAYQVPNLERSGLVHWEEYATEPIDPRRVSGEPFNAGIFGDLPPGLTDAKRLSALRSELIDMLYTTARLKVPYNATLDIYADPDGDFSAFRAQVQQVARERRDAEVDALTRKAEAALDKLEQQAQRKGYRLESEKRELANQKREELFTTGEAVLGLLRGRTSFTLSRMARSSVYRQRSKGEAQLLELDLQQIQEDMARTEEEFEAGLRAINEKWAKIATQVDEYIITPYKKDISLDLFGIGWIPYWYVELNGQPAMLAAFE
ncbi:MAG TPA: DUF87 domain-containing protein [Oceanobacillus sp.]|nr:DUF87 domain-containing protein [Oceanobacillus sp.]